MFLKFYQLYQNDVQIELSNTCNGIEWISFDSVWQWVYYIIQWFYDNYNLILLVGNVALAEPVTHKITESNLHVLRY